MDYIECNFTVEPKHPYTDILVAQLAEAGFESFVEHEQGVKAYIPEAHNYKTILGNVEIWTQPHEGYSIKASVTTIPQQNWNALWEASFQPVTVGMDCIVRAPFHDKLPGFKFEIVIEPKMSFGTGHHETTMLMIEEMLQMNLSRKRVLDMGCGTGILAILAAKMGAEKIVAIDHEKWAYDNTMENCSSNHTQQVLVIHGNAGAIPKQNFDNILANINKNVILNDLALYEQHLATDGILALSGFFVHDIDEIVEKSKNLKLKLLSQKENNSWACITFQKIK